jgi:photosystem II stability/assembly factor-like uncharacterized protein
MAERPRFLGRLALSILLALAQLNKPAWAQSGKTPHVVASSKLVSPGIGWVALMRDSDCAPANVFPPCSPMRLYWTEDNGKHWSNITPPEMSVRNIRQVFFADRIHGWMLSSDALGEETNAPFFLYSTENAGRTWRTLVLRRPMFNMMDDYTFPTELFFSDSQHGWLLWAWGMMNSRRNYLLSTTDGGRSWKSLPDPPLGGSLQFTSPRDGWMIGTSREDQGVPAPENDTIWKTNDGGQHWSEISLPPPSDLKNEGLYFRTLKFSSRREGIVFGERRLVDDPDQHLPLIWITHDGGRTWRFSKLQGPVENVSMIGSRIIRSFHDSVTYELTICKGNQTITPYLPFDFPTRGLGYPDFIDESNAWMGAYVGLLATSDGARSFQVIFPSSAEPEWPTPPQILAVNHKIEK